MDTNNRYQASIDRLNDALGKEIATSLQYMYFHEIFDNAGYEYLARIMHRTSIAEMRHIEHISERIMFLEGDIDMNATFRTVQEHDVKKALEMAMSLEQGTIDSYCDYARLSLLENDAATHELFEDMVHEEEEHLDTFRTEWQNMEDFGDQYLALQAVARSHEKSEGEK